MSTNCPTCGPTATEQHPRQSVTRCANCKEWLSTDASTPASEGLTEAEREALGDWWESDWPDTKEGAIGSLYAVVAQIKADAEAKARADERERIAQAIKAGRDGYLDSPTLDPAWIAGWHSATDHHAARIARGDA